MRCKLGPERKKRRKRWRQRQRQLAQLEDRRVARAVYLLIGGPPKGEWFVDGATGHDGNAGDRLHPLKTLNEFNRRCPQGSIFPVVLNMAKRAP